MFREMYRKHHKKKKKEWSMSLLLFGGKTNRSYRVQSVKGYILLSSDVPEKGKYMFIRGCSKRNG